MGLDNDLNLPWVIQKLLDEIKVWFYVYNEHPIIFLDLDDELRRVKWFSVSNKSIDFDLTINCYPRYFMVEFHHLGERKIKRTQKIETVVEYFKKILKEEYKK